MIPWFWVLDILLVILGHLLVNSTKIEKIKRRILIFLAFLDLRAHKMNTVVWKLFNGLYSSVH